MELCDRKSPRHVHKQPHPECFAQTGSASREEKGRWSTDTARSHFSIHSSTIQFRTHNHSGSKAPTMLFQPSKTSSQLTSQLHLCWHCSGKCCLWGSSQHLKWPLNSPGTHAYTFQPRACWAGSEVRRGSGSVVSIVSSVFSWKVWFPTSAAKVAKLEPCMCAWVCKRVGSCYVLQTVGVLTVAKASVSGVYRCVASNPTGTDQLDLHFYVTGETKMMVYLH